MSNIKYLNIIDSYGFIYLTINMINGKKYIGQRIFKINWQWYVGSGTVLKQAIKKYGRNNFSREIIAIAYSKDELNKLEIDIIKNHNAVESNDYYNISHGGGSPAGVHRSEETKRKIGEASKGRGKGGKLSDEHKYKIGSTLKLGASNKVKLSDQQLIEIREKYSTGNYSQRKLAKEYFVSQPTIERIINFKNAYENII